MASDMTDEVWPTIAQPRTAHWIRALRFSRRSVLWALADCILVAAAVIIAGTTGAVADSTTAATIGRLAAVAVVAELLAGATLGLYRDRWEGGSFDEMAGVVTTSTATTVALLAVDLGDDGIIGPLPLVAAAGLLLMAGTTGARFAVRLLRDHRLRHVTHTGHRVVVVGAGDGGAQIVRAMLRKKDSAYRPVTLIDDDPAKRNLRIMGVPVVGPRSSIPDAVRRHQADIVLLAVPSAKAPLVREVSDLAGASGATFRVLPPVSELIEGNVSINDIRAVSYTDLLGRGEVTTDVTSVSAYLSGKCVLVTGAGGSIGSELCRQLAAQDIQRLVMLDRDESGLHATQLSIEGRALLDSDDLVIGDIRDRRWMFEVFAEHRPDVVFHAAALKHLTLLERHPSEAIKTNIIGTQNVLDAARSVHVSHLVNISTDKAADPVCVLGWSKRIAERLTAEAAWSGDGTFVSVRFGNVLGSRGSVIPAFQAQIEAGGPVTVTDAHATRFFMTIREAVRLVIQAGAIGACGEALVLDMGEPVGIADVARRLIELSGRPIDIVYTGLRPGEKLDEQLFGAGEQDRRPVHPQISHVTVPPLSEAQLRTLRGHMPRRVAAAELRSLSSAPPAVIDVRRFDQRQRNAVAVSTAR